MDPMRLQDYAPRPAHLKWLLDSDPAIRWQVMRDLTDAAPDAIAAERARVATEGWGAQLLAAQSPAGKWGGSPRGWRDDMPVEHRDMLITFYSLVVLKDLGLDPASRQARKMIDRVDRRVVYRSLDNRAFFDGETEPCINGRILGLGAYFKGPNDALAARLVSEQLDDGGWNCEAPPEPVLLVPYDHLRPRRPPRLRTRRRQISGRQQGPQASRSLPSRPPPVPLPPNRRNRRQALAPLFLSHLLAL